MRLLEHRFEQQVEQEVVAADVDDKGDRRSDPGDIRKILIRSDAELRAATDTALVEVGHHVEIRPLIRN